MFLWISFIRKKTPTNSTGCLFDPDVVVVVEGMMVVVVVVLVNRPAALSNSHLV